MANILNGNTYFIDSASSSGTSGSYYAQKDVLVVGIIFDGTTAGQYITLNDLQQFGDTGAVAAGPGKLRITLDSSKSSVFLRLSDIPLKFPNGIWISHLDAGATATLIIVPKS